MKIKSIYTVFTFVFLFVPQLLAQTPNTGSVLSWTDCVSVAAKNNPTITSSKYSLQSNRYSYYGSYNGFMPQVSLSHSYSDSSTSLLGSNKWQTSG